MLLVNFVDKKINSKQLLKTIKHYQIQKVLLIALNTEHESNVTIEEENTADVLIIEPQDDVKSFTFKFLHSLKIDFEYLEISSNITSSSFIALLATKFVNSRLAATVDLTNCPISLQPFVFQTAYYIPTFVNEVIFQSNDRQLTKVSYPLIAFDFDPDKETMLLKEILALFLTHQTNYSDFAFNKTLSSTLLLQLINDEQVRNGCKDYKYPYIQACLSQLSQEIKGKINYIQRRHNSSDKRALVYTITDQGVLTLLIWYLQQISSEDKIIPLHTKLNEFFSEFTFSEISNHYISNSNVCSICENKHVPELYTCSICGQESCKDCLDNHYLNNKCQPQLQLV